MKHMGSSSNSLRMGTIQNCMQLLNDLLHGVFCYGIVRNTQGVSARSLLTALLTPGRERFQQLPHEGYPALHTAAQCMTECPTLL